MSRRILSWKRYQLRRQQGRGSRIFFRRHYSCSAPWGITNVVSYFSQDKTGLHRILLFSYRRRAFSPKFPRTGEHADRKAVFPLYTYSIADLFRAKMDWVQCCNGLDQHTSNGSLSDSNWVAFPNSRRRCIPKFGRHKATILRKTNVS